ncbi:hypothetical protein ABZX92_03905 [Lentzea sp. NPDC006480]|uniref:hypothetical protein n=1 Tax=Lentzea sp. NPDC006480 TaxID=3157176 RepID=UPI0033B4A012
MHINWSGLGEVFAVSLVLGVGIVTLFSAGLAVADRGHRVVPAVSFAACAALVGYGIYLVAVH